MFEFFRKYLTGNISLSEAEMARIAAVSTLKKLSRKQLLLEKGTVWQHYLFVCHGCLRMYQVNDNGEEQTRKFCTGSWWAGDRTSLVSGEPSLFYIDALEESVLVMMEKDDFEQLCREIPAFNKLVLPLVSRNYAISQGKTSNGFVASCEQRYLKLVKKYPRVISRVPMYMVASYLGVSPDTLSAIHLQFSGK